MRSNIFFITCGQKRNKISREGREVCEENLPLFTSPTSFGIIILNFNVKYCIKCVASILFVVLGFCGYSQTPQKLGDQIADADRVVAYDVAQGSTFSVTGQGTKVLIHAIATAEKLNGATLTGPTYWIQFYRQTNLLGSIGAGGNWFMHELKSEPNYLREEYIEKGHVLEAWEHRLETDKAAQRAWVNLLAQDAIRGAGVTNLQVWSVELLKLCESGRFGTHGFPDRDGGSNIQVSPRPKVPGWAEVTNRWPDVHDPDVFVHCSPSGKPEGVFVSLVGLPIPYGLALGSTNYVTTVHAWYTTNCAPGIYAFHRGY